MDNEEALSEARQRVADRYPHAYTKNAILNGFWDGGNLVKEAYADIICERRVIGQ
jgi:hypothetical protein